MNRYSRVSKIWTILQLPLPQLLYAVLIAATVIFLSSPSFAEKGQPRSTPAAAQAAFQTEFRNAASQIPNALLQSGYTNFGRLNLAQLNQRIASVKVVVVSTQDIRDSNGGDRSSAHWTNLPSAQQIAVSLAWWKYFDAQHTVLALHEVLGEFGFQDGEYWISTSLWLLTLPEAQTLTGAQRKLVGKWIMQNAGYDIASGGTVIGVGGGGESASLWWRMESLQLSLREMSEATSAENRNDKWEFLLHILSSLMTSRVDGIHGVEESSTAAIRTPRRPKP